jgi:hypothetical protein
MRSRITRWCWKRALFVGVLTFLAGLAGYKSELMADQNTYTTTGNSLNAHWNGFLANVSSDMDVTGSSSVTGPGKLAPVTTMWISGSTYSPGSNWPYTTVWTSLNGGADIPNADLNIALNGSGSAGTLTATVPATYEVQSWSNGTSWTTVAATVNVSLSARSVFTEKTRNFSHQHSVSHTVGTTGSLALPGGGNGGALTSSWLQSNFDKSQTSVDATGAGGVSLNDGVNPAFDYVSQNTATSWGTLRSSVSGTHTIQSH